MFSRKNTAIAVIALCLWCVKSEGGPIVGVGWDRSPDTYTKVRFPPYSNEKVGIAAFSWWIANEWASEQRPLTLAAQFRYARWRQEQDVDFSGLLFLPENLYSLELAFCLTGVLWAGTQTTVFVAPVLENASEATIKLGDLKTNLGILHRYDLGKSGVGLGVAWLRTFGRGYALPLLEISWADQTHGVGARVLLPLELELHWQPKTDLLLRLRMHVAGGEYRTDEGSQNLDAWIRLWSVVFGPQIQISPKELVHFSIGGGWVFDRHLDKIQSVSTSRVRREMEGAPYWQATIAFGEPLKHFRIPETLGWR